MKNKKRFSNNPYKNNDLTPWQKMHEIALSFWKSRSNWMSKKHCTKYYQNTNIKNWITTHKIIKSSYAPTITWIGHSTFLIQKAGFNILTDPIFNDLMYLYPRNCTPGISLDQLPKIDFIIISHGHIDHMNKKTLLSLRQHNPTIIVPYGEKNWFIKKGFTNVIDKKWWEEESFSLKKDQSKKIKFHFLPAIHWAGNNPFNMNKSWWGSFIIEFDNFKTYFAGDTAYSKHFLDINKKHPDIDIALMPIAPNGPEKVIEHSHIDAKQSVQSFIDLDAKEFIPMHWGTFRMATDKFIEPITLLKEAWNKNIKSLQNKKLHILKFGEQINF